jgi:hypothetical protein
MWGSWICVIAIINMHVDYLECNTESSKRKREKKEQSILGPKLAAPKP